ncbi:MAG: hypothetical protein AB8H79_23425 [Myxococcota bacterium]
MTPSLRPLLIRFDADPKLANAVVHALRDIDEWFIAHTPTGDPVTLERGGRRYLALAQTRDEWQNAEDLRPVDAKRVWALVICGRAGGIVLDVHGPSPAWISTDGVMRIGGVPGLALDGALTARSVTEAHLAMDLLGWPPGTRNHRLVSVGDTMLAEYEFPQAPAPMPSLLRFNIPNPGRGEADFGGPEPSTLLDPVAWLVAADRYIQGVPGVDAPQNSAQSKAYALRLTLAAACLDEAKRFAVEGQVHPQDLFTDQSRHVAELAPERLDPERLTKVARAWRRMATSFAAQASP